MDARNLAKIPKAVALASTGLTWARVGQEAGIPTSTLKRLRKTPQWAAEEARLKREDEEDRQAVRNRAVNARARTLEVMEAQRQRAAVAFANTLAKVNEVLLRPPRNDDITVTEDGQPVKVTKRPPVDEAATLAARLAAGGGLRFLADAAVKGMYVPSDGIVGAGGDSEDAAEAFRLEVERALERAESDEAQQAAG